MDPWKHRSDGMRCKTCMWFVGKASGGIATTLAGVDKPVIHMGRCRRHAPTLSGYPAVFVNDWCGDHKLDENKLPENQRSVSAEEIGPSKAIPPMGYRSEVPWSAPPAPEGMYRKTSEDQEF